MNNDFDNVMLDIETLSIHRFKAVILTIGAVEFNMTKQSPVIGRDFLVAPSLREQLYFDREVTKDTQKWWADPAKATAKHNWLATPEQPIEEAIAALKAFVKDRPVWAHGMNFDITNVEGLAEDAQVKAPWSYNQVRDERTIFKFSPVLRTQPDEDKDGTLIAHDAVDDCIRQVWSMWQRTPIESLRQVA